MSEGVFRTPSSPLVPVITAGQMMENAGRNLALIAMDPVGAAIGEVTISACAGGNGGGGLEPLPSDLVDEAIRHAGLVVDGLIGCSLRGAPHGRAVELIELCSHHATRILSLALPKTGLRDRSGELYLADIGIPPEVFDAIGVPYDTPFEDQYIVPLTEAD